MAHYRRVWFQPSETFLYTTVGSCRATRPLLVGSRRENEAAFPVGVPVLALHPAGTASGLAFALRERFLGHHRPYFSTRRAHRALRRFGASVLHAHFGYTGWQLLATRRALGLPLVTTFYGMDASMLARDPVWRTRFAELFAEGDRFLAEGPHLVDRLVELGCPPEKLAVQRIAIEAARYPFRERKPKPPGEPVRGFFCARFCAKKGLAWALEAVALAREEHPELELRIAGDGPDRPLVEERIAALGLEDAVELLGFVSHASMIEEMNAADFFLQPSVTAADGDSEGGAPTTLLEAQACGLPVLASRHADIPYVVREGESALLASERDTAGLAEQISALLSYPRRWAAMGAAGRAHVESRHDAAVEVARLEQLYLELAGAT